MTTTAVPTLSEDGWVTDPGKMLDYLFSYYILTDAQQTIVFRDSIISLPATYHLYINDPDGLAEAIRSDFSKLLDRHFSNSEVQCYAKQDPISPSIYYLFLSAIITDDSGTRYELNKITQLREGRSTKVIQYNNYGDAYNDFSAF
jgi:hypothetical protein